MYLIHDVRQINTEEDDFWLGPRAFWFSCCNACVKPLLAWDACSMWLNINCRPLALARTHHDLITISADNNAQASRWRSVRLSWYLRWLEGRKWIQVRFPRHSPIHAHAHEIYLVSYTPKGPWVSYTRPPGQDEAEGRAGSHYSAVSEAWSDLSCNCKILWSPSHQFSRQRYAADC